MFPVVVVPPVGVCPCHFLLGSNCFGGCIRREDVKMKARAEAVLGIDLGDEDWGASDAVRTPDFREHVGLDWDCPSCCE